jgi:RNA polymerase sigma-70 factor (ECF subfamily)
MPEHDTTEDYQALLRCRQGDRQAYGIVVKKYMQRAYFTALALVGNRDDALDLSQEAFVRAYQALARFDLHQQFFTWYYRILRNICLNHLRNHAKFVNLSEAKESETVDRGADPAALAERNDLSERLWKALASLRDEQREVIILKDLEDCSYKEIAERLEIPLGTVMSRLFNARKHLKEKLGKLL